MVSLFREYGVSNRWWPRWGAFLNPVYGRRITLAIRRCAFGRNVFTLNNICPLQSHRLRWRASFVDFDPHPADDPRAHLN
jgi:hypothetical protein